MGQHLTNIVVAAFIVRGDKVLIARRAATKSFHPGMYELVGGHLEPGEQPVEALQREVEEEIRLKVRVGDIVDAFTYDTDGELKVELCYICYLEDETTEPVLNSEDHSEYAWITEAEISKFEKEDEETEALRKAFKYLKGGN